MSIFSDVFTQGGQTQLHKIRMITQVLGATIKASLWIMLIAFVLLVYGDHVWQDLWFLLCYGKACLRVEHLNFLPYEFFDTSWVVNKDGTLHELSDAWLIREERLNLMAYGIGLSLIKKFFQAILVSLIGLFVISWFWVNRGKNKQETKILSGSELVSSKTLKKLIQKTGTSCYQIGDIPLPKNSEFQHMMITGTTGSGKSNAIHQLLKQIRDQGDQAVIVDTTGGILSRFYDADKDILLNPLDARSQNWNMWDEIKSESIIDEIAESVIPDNKSYDSFWTQGARQLFCESAKFLMSMNQRSYQELINMTLKLSLKDLSSRLQGTIVTSMIDPSLDKTALSVRASLAVYLKSFICLEHVEQGFSFLDYVGQQQKGWLFLSCQTDQREYLKPLYSAWISLIIKGLIRREETHQKRTWIIIDELASLNRLPSLMMGLAEARKYGGCFVLGFQDLCQLEEVYGLSPTRTLSNLTGTKVVFRCVDTDIAARVARYMGEQEKQEASESISFGAHQMRDGVSLANHKKVEQVIRASEVMMLKDLEAFVKFSGAPHVSKIKFDYYDLKLQTPRFIPKQQIMPFTPNLKDEVQQSMLRYDCYGKKISSFKTGRP